MNWITELVWLVTQTQILWSVKSSGPSLEALLVDVMKFQQNNSDPSRRMPTAFYIHYIRKSGRPSSGDRTGKSQSSSQFPRRVVPKNALSIGQLHSSPMLVRSCLKSCLLGFSIMRTKNFQMSSWVSKRKRN